MAKRNDFCHAFVAYFECGFTQVRIRYLNDVRELNSVCGGVVETESVCEDEWGRSVW